MEGSWKRKKKTLLLFGVSLNEISRGNKRDVDRQRAQARNGCKGPKKDGLTPEQRRERDAKALQEKAAKKAVQVAGVDVNAKTKKN